MSLLEYSNFQRSPAIANPNGVSSYGPNSFSVSWTSTPNAMGIKPPNPQFQQDPLPSYVVPMTIGASPNKVGNYPIGLIQSKRYPYAVEWMTNGFGALETRLGTMLGTNQ